MAVLILWATLSVKQTTAPHSSVKSGLVFPSDGTTRHQTSSMCSRPWDMSGFFSTQSSVCPGLGQHGFISIKMFLAGRGQGGPSSIMPKKLKAFPSLHSWVLLRGIRKGGSVFLKHHRKTNRISDAQELCWCQRGDIMVFKNCNKAVKAWMSFKWKSQIHPLS